MANKKLTALPDGGALQSTDVIYGVRPGNPDTDYRFTGANVGAGGGASVLWEWNGADVSQLGDGAGNPDATVGTATGTISRSTLHTAAGGVIDGEDVPVIWFQNGGVGTGERIFLINDLPTMPDRYVLQWRTGPRSAGVFVNCAPSVTLVYQATTHRVICYSNGAGSYRAVSANGAGEDAANTGAFAGFGTVADVNNGDYMKCLVDVSEPDVSNDPGLTFAWEGLFNRGAAAGRTTGWTAFGGGNPFNVSFDAGWRTGGTVKRPGVSFFELAALAGGSYISDLRILSFP